MRRRSSAIRLIKKHIGIKRLAKILIILFILFALAIISLPWQQTARGTGRVVALSPNEREQVISAPVSGRLGKWFVQDGSVVEQGDPIIQLVDNDAQLLERLQAEEKAIIDRINIAEKASKTAYANVLRQKKLYEEGIASQKAYEQADVNYLTYKNEINKAKVELAKIKVIIARQKNQMVTAPLTGTIIRRLSGENSVLVKQGDPLATLIPKTNTIAVEMWLNGNDIPLVHLDAPVRLQFEGWPAVQISGWPSLAVGTFDGKVVAIDPADNGQGLFRILVVPKQQSDWPGANYLRQGVRAYGWVMLDRVPLWFELWRRFNGFPPGIQPNSGINAKEKV